MSPTLIWAGVGLKPYLVAGNSSAAAIKLVAERLAVERRASDTGAFCAAAVAVRQKRARGSRRSEGFIFLTLRLDGDVTPSDGLPCHFERSEKSDGLPVGLPFKTSR